MKKPLALLFSLFIAAALMGCGKKVPLADDQKSFAGTWIAGDGTFVTVYLDGGGDLKSSNTTVTGGRATITDTTLTIGMGPIKKTMAITKKPTNVGGREILILDGITYTKK